jgi:hypothetical protein
LVGGHDDQTYVEFDEIEGHFAESVLKTIQELETIQGIRVRRVGPEQLVTISAAAGRLGRSPESIRLLAEGKRGPGTFPPPLAYVDAKTRLWEWSAIAKWWQDTYGNDEQLAQHADFLHSVNDLLDFRARSSSLATEEKEALKHFSEGALAV